MKIGDLVSVGEAPGSLDHIGIVIDLYDALEPDGEAQILWSDGKLFWERIGQLLCRAEVI